MLTIVNQQPDVTALQVQECRKCYVHHSLSSPCTEQRSAMLIVVMHLPAADESEQVKSSSGQWIDAEPIDGAFVCNIGGHCEDSSVILQYCHVHSTQQHLSAQLAHR